MEGGPIAAVHEGDIISINIPEGVLDVKISDEELQSRMSRWNTPEPKIKKGYLARYARMVSSADKGAILT